MGIQSFWCRQNGRLVFSIWQLWKWPWGKEITEEDLKWEALIGLGGTFVKVCIIRLDHCANYLPLWFIVSSRKSSSWWLGFVIILEKLIVTLGENNQKFLKIVKMYFIQNISIFTYLVTLWLKTKCKQIQVIMMTSCKSRRGIKVADNWCNWLHSCR